MNELVPLGKTSLQVNGLGVGTWAWGDTSVWGYGKGYSDSDLRDAFNQRFQRRPWSGPAVDGRHGLGPGVAGRRVCGVLRLYQLGRHGQPAIY